MGDEPLWEEYETAVDPTGTGITSGNDIIELDPNIETVETEYGAREMPDVSVEDLAIIAETLADHSADEESAQIEIERRHLEANADHTLRFIARDLTNIAIVLSVANITATYNQDYDTIASIRNFGDLIKDSDDAPMDGRKYGITLPGIEPTEGEYVDPFSAICGKQTLVIVDEDGEQLDADEVEGGKHLDVIEG